jgi:hypothetical protein
VNEPLRGDVVWLEPDDAFIGRLAPERVDQIVDGLRFQQRAFFPR